MLFWFKKKKVILECFTTNEIAYNYAKVDTMMKFLPDWWKKTKKIEHGHHTIKTCIGLMDFYKKSITIPSWFRIRIVLSNDGKYEWKTTNDVSITHHHHIQFKDFALNDGYNIKILSPWSFRTKTLKYFSWSNPLYNHRNLISCMTFMPAVIEFKYNHHTHINYIISNIKEETTVEIEPFTPMVAIHPMFEDEIEIKNFLIDENELEKINYSGFFLFNDQFSTTYKNKKKIINHVESNRSKCPFGFK